MRTVVETAIAAASGPGTLTVGDTVTSWARLHDRARRMATALMRHGITRGSRVGLYAATGIDLMTAIQAGWLTGAAVTVLAPPPRRAAPGWHHKVLADARFHLLLTDSELDTGGVRTLSLPQVTTESALLPAVPIVLPALSDLALLQYTSGSTSDPRGVPVSHGHLAANLDAIRQAFSVGGRPVRMLSWLPLYHDMGLIGFACLPMACGWTLVLQSPTAFALRPMSWLDAAARHRSTVTGAPDFAFRMLTPLLARRKDLDLSSLRFVLCGGEPISVETMRRFVEAAQPCRFDPAALVPAYGLAEATLAVSISHPGAGVRLDPRRALVRLGPPVPGADIRIVDPATGEPLRSTQVGRIEVRGPSVVGHYWGQPAPPPQTWLDTGDLGYLCEGELVVCGRHKDLVICAGRNIHPQDAEAAAGQVTQAGSRGVVAFGVPGDDGDQLIVAVELRGADNPDVRRSVTAAVAAATGVSPAEVLTLKPGRIPLTSSGKLRRAEARRLYLHGQLTSERTVR